MWSPRQDLVPVVLPADELASRLGAREGHRGRLAGGLHRQGGEGVGVLFEHDDGRASFGEFREHLRLGRARQRHPAGRATVERVRLDEHDVRRRASQLGQRRRDLGVAPVAP